MNIVSLYLYYADLLSQLDGLSGLFAFTSFSTTVILLLISFLAGETRKIREEYWMNKSTGEARKHYNVPWGRREDEWVKLPPIDHKTYVRLYPWLAKWTRLTIPLMFFFSVICILIPEKNTMLLIATSQTAEYVATTPAGSEAVDLFNDTVKLIRKQVNNQLGIKEE